MWGDSRSTCRERTRSFPVKRASTILKYLVTRITRWSPSVIHGVNSTHTWRGWSIWKRIQRPLNKLFAYWFPLNLSPTAWRMDVVCCTWSSWTTITMKNRWENGRYKWALQKVPCTNFAHSDFRCTGLCHAHLHSKSKISLTVSLIFNEKFWKKDGIRDLQITLIWGLECYSQYLGIDRFYDNGHLKR